MRSAHDDFRVISTVAEYTEFCALPPPLHPLITVIDLETTRGGQGVELEPIVQNLYMIAIKRGLKGKLIYGRTTQQHIHAALIDKAKRLLLSTSMTVNETAYALGFDYPQYFSRLFKQKTGLTPGVFRSSAN